MSRRECEVGIIGAGVAGLSAAAELARAGIAVHCLEATDRVGGRILTVHDPLSPLPIELGAEFVHGRPPEIWDRVCDQGLTLYEHTGRAVYRLDGKTVKAADVGDTADQLLEEMAKSRRDEAFEDYLRRSRHSTEAKNWARIYVEGFNAARSDAISTGSLVREAKAADRIEGDRAFRIVQGYDAIPLGLLRAIPHHTSVVQLNSVVERVTWGAGGVRVDFHSAISEEKFTLQCRRLIVTVPLA